VSTTLDYVAGPFPVSGKPTSFGYARRVEAAVVIEVFVDGSAARGTSQTVTADGSAARGTSPTVTIERATFADEPVTVSRLSNGRVLRQLGGKNARGGQTYVNHWTQVSPAGTWPPTALPVTLMIGLPRSRDLGMMEDALVDLGARTWGRVSCTSFRATVGGTTTSGPGDDGISGVYFEDTAWPTDLTPGAIATTVVHVNAQGQIYDTDIYVNGAENVFSLDGHGTTIDFRSTAVHEIGHVLGLGESNDPTATMYASYPPGVSWRAVETDDEDGVCTLYPGTGDSDGCVVTACPTGFDCVARDCVLPQDQRMTCSPCEPSLTNGCEGMGHSARCVGYAGGYACGRPCESDTDCGPGFTCNRTTGAGDFQCVSTSGCAASESACTAQSDCADPDSIGWICPAGACLGPLPVDAGTDASASPDAGSGVTASGGCNASSRPSGDAWLFMASVAGLVGARRRPRKR
jgi:MYXO-CTERM domain-containing protein